MGSSDEHGDRGGAGQTPEDRRSLPGNQTMQLDALGEEIFEELDRQYEGAPEASVKPPPLPPKKRWTGKAVGALVAVVLGAAMLAVLASLLLFGDEEAEAPVAATPQAAGGAGGATGQAEGEEPEVIPLQLDEVVIESGNERGDEP